MQIFKMIVNQNTSVHCRCWFCAEVSWSSEWVGKGMTGRVRLGSDTAGTHGLARWGGGGDLVGSKFDVGNLPFQFGRQVYHAKSRGQVKILLPRLRRKRI